MSSIERTTCVLRRVLYAATALSLTGTLLVATGCDDEEGGDTDTTMTDTTTDAGEDTTTGEDTTGEDTTGEDTTGEDTTADTTGEDTTTADTTGEDTTTDTGTDMADTTPPMGEASLAFEPRYAQPGAPIWSGWETYSAGWSSDDPLVFMLCAQADTTCESPLLVREVDPGETDGDPIQPSFGPAITLQGLPAGTYQFMVFTDSAESRNIGLGFQDDFPNKETAWGGIVSETDVMMIADDATPEDNPPPTPREVTLTDGEVTDLDVIQLGHYHHRDIFPELDTENGVLAVATETGVRVIDMGVWPFEVVEAYPGFYEYIMQDAAGQPLPGSVCGALDLEDGTILVLYSAGFGVHFDPLTGTQGNQVDFPDVGAGSPCEGNIILHEVGGQRLIIAARAGSTAGGLWVADADGLANGDVTATAISSSSDTAAPGIERIANAGVKALAAHETTVFLSLSPDAAAENYLEPGIANQRVVFVADLDTTNLTLTARENAGTLEHVVIASLADSITLPGLGQVLCNPNAVTAADQVSALAVANFAPTGHDLLFATGCTQIHIFDIDDGLARLDFNGAAPGGPGMSAVNFGQSFMRFAFSADGNTLWALPWDKSEVFFNFMNEGDPDDRFGTDRWMLMPISLTEGETLGTTTVPIIEPAFNTTNLDDWEGPAGIGNYDSPAIDPGIDLIYAWYTRYLRSMFDDAPGFGAITNPTYPRIAVTDGMIWVGAPGQGLSLGEDLQTIDLDEQRQYLWPRDPDDGFYKFFEGGVGDGIRFGYDLTPDINNDDHVSVRGMVYVPRP